MIDLITPLEFGLYEALAIVTFMLLVYGFGILMGWRG